MKNYDVIVIGAGPGGYVAAIKAAQLGNKVAIIEKQYVGGVCLNVGCIPTKTLLKSAKVYQYIREASKYGVDIADYSGIKINWDNMKKRKNDVVHKLTSGVEFLLKKNKVDIYNGFGEDGGDHKVTVNGETLGYKKLILATGSKPRMIDLPGLEDGYKRDFVVTSTELLNIEKLPKSLVVVGGGVIGMEFACLFNTLGVDVTVIEFAPNILSALDDEVKQELQKVFLKQGIHITCNARVTKFEGDTVYYEIGGKTESIKTEKVLFSVGRTENLNGFENLKVDKRDNGSIITDDQCRTSNPDIYALGDINGQIMLAHLASAEGIVAAEAINGMDSKINYSAVPNCVYSFPEVATVGKTERELKEQKITYKSSKFPISANGKALAEGDSQGFIKILSGDNYGEILGVHIVAANATDMIAEIVTTMELEGTVHELAKAIHPHPTLSEIVMEAAHEAAGQAIHI